MIIENKRKEVYKMNKFQKIAIIIIISMFISFVSGLFFGYWNVIHYQRITEDNNYYYVEFMNNEYYYYKD